MDADSPAVIRVSAESENVFVGIWQMAGLESSHYGRVRLAGRDVCDLGACLLEDIEAIELGIISHSQSFRGNLPESRWE